MRYLVDFVFVLALVAAPLSVSAQDIEQGDSSVEPSQPEASADSAEPATEALSPSVGAALDLRFWHDEALRLLLFGESGNAAPEWESMGTLPASSLQLGANSSGVELTPLESAEIQENGDRGGRIAMAVLIPVMLLGVSLGITAAATRSFRNGDTL